jgi:hypothetical protein
MESGTRPDLSGEIALDTIVELIKAIINHGVKQEAL